MPTHPYACSVEDWPRLMRVSWETELLWMGEPDLSAWIAQSRLNLLRALPDHAAEPAVRTAVERYLTHVGPAIERMRQLDA